MVYKKCFKRLLDIVISLIAIVVLLIPAVIIAILVKADSPGPAVFKQVRLGKNRTPFVMYKFRSMVVNDQSDCVMQSDEGDPRITKVGAFIRDKSLDEIPQFINILLGRMSLIGPRPMLPAEYELYSEELPDLDERFAVRPGLFCTVDVEYRAEASMELQWEFDREYIERCSFLVDLKCFFGVFVSVIQEKNIYSISKS